MCQLESNFAGRKFGRFLTQVICSDLAEKMATKGNSCYDWPLYKKKKKLLGDLQNYVFGEITQPSYIYQHICICKQPSLFCMDQQDCHNYRTNINMGHIYIYIYNISKIYLHITIEILPYMLLPLFFRICTKNQDDIEQFFLRMYICM